MAGSSSSDFSVLENLIQTTFQSSHTIHHIEDLSNHLHQIRLVRLSNGSRLVLKLSPLPSTPRLRQERQCLENEALTLSILSKDGLPIPRMLKYDPHSKAVGSPFLLTTHLPGAPCAEMGPYLSAADRVGIERQLGELASVIAKHQSSTFGPVSLVPEGHGHRSWREAFSSLLESALRDGEDMLVSLPYTQIRDQAARLGGALDEVEDAALVVPTLGDLQNVLIDPTTKKVTGLIDFGYSIWGDVDMAYGQEDGGTKGLLYACYGAVVRIVTIYHRAQRGGKELDARKDLTMTLAQLAAVRSDR